MDKLSEAIEDVYRAFADVQKPVRVERCPCCIDEIQLKKLVRTPLRELSGDQLSSYASAAFLTVGDVADYLYFLPRILEISIRDEGWWPDIEVTARAVHSTDLPSWPQNRGEALSSLLHAFIDYVVETGAYSRIDDWLCAIARMEIDVQPFLSIIEKDQEAVLYYWEVNAKCLTEEKLSNAFWQLPNRGHDDIIKWFKSDSISNFYGEM